MNSTLPLALVAILIGRASLPESNAQTAPNEINYQATVHDENGNLVADAAPGEFQVEFRIYDEALGGNLIWAEEQTITIFQGRFNTILGQGAAIGAEPGGSLRGAFTEPHRYLEFTIVDNGEPFAFSPRQKLVSAPYALRSEIANAVVDGSINGNSIEPGGYLWRSNAAGGPYTPSSNPANASFVGIGTANPTSSLHIFESNARAVVESKDSLGRARSEVKVPQVTTTGDQNAIHGGGLFVQRGNGIGSLPSRRLVLYGIRSSGALFPLVNFGGSSTAIFSGNVRGNSFIENSDQRLKKDILDLDGALEKICSLRGVTFDWRADESPEVAFVEGRQVGLIAQEVEKVIPEVVTRPNSNDPNGYYGVSYSKVVPVLVEAVKELDAENRELKERLDRLEEMLSNIPRPKTAHWESHTNIVD